MDEDIVMLQEVEETAGVEGHVVVLRSSCGGAPASIPQSSISAARVVLVNSNQGLVINLDLVVCEDVKSTGHGSTYRDCIIREGMDQRVVSRNCVRLIRAVQRRLNGIFEAGAAVIPCRQIQTPHAVGIIGRDPCTLTYEKVLVRFANTAPAMGHGYICLLYTSPSPRDRG